MDDDRTYLAAAIYIHEGFSQNRLLGKVSSKMLEFMTEFEQARKEFIWEYLKTH